MIHYKSFYLTILAVLATMATTYSYTQETISKDTSSVLLKRKQISSIIPDTLPKVQVVTPKVTETKSELIPFLITVFGVGYGSYLIDVKEKDTSHCYIDFVLVHFKTKKKWNSFQFEKSDQVQFLLESGKQVTFTNFDTTYNSIMYNNEYATSTNGNTTYVSNGPSYKLFHAVFEVNSAQLDQFCNDRIRRIAVTTSTRKMKTRANGKRFEKKIEEFKVLINNDPS